MAPHTELAHRMPWTVAEPESWWEVTGQAGPRHTFERCIARVLPPFITGTDAPLFEVLIYGDPHVVPASAITRARRLVFVLADEPTRAYHEDEQAFLPPEAGA